MIRRTCEKGKRMEGNNCNNCEKKDQACVPFFLHENALMLYSRVNKRMLILFCVWCVTIAVIIGIFVYGNTVREKQLIDLVNQRITEAGNGVYEQSDP